MKGVQRPRVTIGARAGAAGGAGLEVARGTHTSRCRPPLVPDAPRRTSRAPVDDTLPYLTSHKESHTLATPHTSAYNIASAAALRKSLLEVTNDKVLRANDACGCGG